jgi:hypothetical protein
MISKNKKLVTKIKEPSYHLLTRVINCQCILYVGVEVRILTNKTRIINFVKKKG